VGVLLARTAAPYGLWRLSPRTTEQHFEEVSEGDRNNAGPIMKPSSGPEVQYFDCAPLF
jgi:hypothetical protein